ncbi:MAG TPA: response regulator [Opitutaceae bacterium]|jgi:two-component system LytT family response regulator
MKLRAYLVDDEPLALARLKRMLEGTDRVEVMGTSTLPEAAIAAMTVQPPEVCFIDIQMPRLNGFEVLASLPRQPVVVFTTAHEQYALKAFAVNSVDYLLKPIEPAALERALDKIDSLRRSDSSARPNLPEVLAQLIASLREPPPDYLERIASRLGDRLRFLDLPAVTHFYAEDKLTFAASEGKAYCVDHSIAELEQKLDPKQFVRVHRRTIVSLAWIREIEALPGGSLHLRLKDGAATGLTVARDRAREFKQRIGL